MPAAESTVLLVMNFQPAVEAHVGTPDVVRGASQCGRRGASARHPADLRPCRVPARIPGGEFGQQELRFAGSNRHRIRRSGRADGPPPGVHNPGTDVSVVKRRTSAFSGSDLDVLLHTAHVERLVLAGLTTSGVVLSTVREAADRDYKITVLSDACHDSDEDVQRVLLDKRIPHQAVQDWTQTLDAQ
jgi:hypothetical protein